MPSIKSLIKQEEKRQQGTLDLIASDNIIPADVREALSSVLANKYAEGYPHKRYYGGNEVIDEVELEAIRAARKLFGAEYANVQPYSGTPANLAIYTGLLELGDRVMGMSLAHGGHLSHGHKVSFSGKAYKFTQYGVDSKTGLLDYDEIQKLAKIFKPKLIVCGATAYPRVIDFKKFRRIAKSVGAYFMADISHIAGLIAGGVHPSPFPHADVVMTTTHKTLRGPRGAIILCKESLGEMIDKAVFPGIQGGPHQNVIAAKALCLQNAAKPAFKRYAKQVVANAKALADELNKLGFDLVSGGTDTHLILIDLTNKDLTGKQAEVALNKAGIVVNKNMVPNDPRSPFSPSGMRIGVASITSRGMKTSEMKKIGQLINRVVADRKSSLVLNRTRKEVLKLCKKFPIS